jgi:hypothetical protein
MTVPGVVFHPRTAWQDPAKPVTGPASDLSQVDIESVHYPWADVPDGDVTDLLDVGAFLRRIQSDYLRSRGYSIGYNFAVDWLGGVWELRGWDIRCAANATVNRRTFALLMLVDWDGPATDLALTAAHRIYEEGLRRTGRSSLLTLGHNQLPDPKSPTGLVRTGCAGAGLTVQLNQRLCVPPPPEPEPEPTPRKAVPDMVIITYQQTGWPGAATFKVSADTLDHAQNGVAIDVLAFAGVPRIEVSRDQMVHFLRDPSTRHQSLTAGGANLGQPFAGAYFDAELAAAWSAGQW